MVSHVIRGYWLYWGRNHSYDKHLYQFTELRFNLLKNPVSLKSTERLIQLIIIIDCSESNFLTLLAVIIFCYECKTRQPVLSIRACQCNHRVLTQLSHIFSGLSKSVCTEGGEWHVNLAFIAGLNIHIIAYYLLPLTHIMYIWFTNDRWGRHLPSMVASSTWIILSTVVSDYCYCYDLQHQSYFSA